MDDPKGHPRNPMATSELAAKLDDCATFSARPFSSQRVQALTQAVDALQCAADLTALTGALA